jgi:hypothetical protein
MKIHLPASPAYGVYISQLIRYARASNNYSDFLKRHQRPHESSYLLQAFEETPTHIEVNDCMDGLFILLTFALCIIF